MDGDTSIVALALVRERRRVRPRIESRVLALESATWQPDSSNESWPISWYMRGSTPPYSARTAWLISATTSARPFQSRFCPGRTRKRRTPPQSDSARRASMRASRSASGERKGLRGPPALATR